MFDILFYLYETYYRPEALPKRADLARDLSEIGFRESEINDALIWITDLTETTQSFADHYPELGGFSVVQRIYADQEISALGAEAIGILRRLEACGILDPIQREIIVERALAVNETPLPRDTLRLIVLMTLWSQGQEPHEQMLDALFPEPDGVAPPLLH